MSRLRLNSTESLILAVAVAPFLAFGAYALWPSSPSGSSETTPKSLSQNALTKPITFDDVSVPSGTFDYGGSTTWAPIRNTADSLIQQRYPNFVLRYTEDGKTAPGSGAGIQMLLKNQLSFSQSSREIKEKEYQQAKDLGLVIKETSVAIDGIVISVHPELPVDHLSIADLNRIYRGGVTNWQTLGGPNLAITPYTRRREDSGTVEFFAKRVMNEGGFGDSVVFVDTLTTGLRQVSQDRGGIYYGSAPEVIPQCEIKALSLISAAGDIVSPYKGTYIPPEQCPDARNQINTEAFQSGEYPLTRKLYVISDNSDPSKREVANAYAELLLTNEGQQMIQEAGFVPIRDE